MLTLAIRASAARPAAVLARAIAAVVVSLPALALAAPGASLGGGAAQVTSFLQQALDFAIWTVSPLLMGFALLWAFASWAFGNPQGLGRAISVVIAAVCIFCIGGILNTLMAFGR
jgi:hypothetical protein